MASRTINRTTLVPNHARRSARSARFARSFMMDLQAQVAYQDADASSDDGARSIARGSAEPNVRVRSCMPRRCHRRLSRARLSVAPAPLPDGVHSDRFLVLL